MSSVTHMTTPLSCARNVRCTTANWSPRVVARIPHRDGGVEVRRLFHKLRSRAIEPFNGVFKNIFEWRG
jgi:hypothetical protein